MTLVFGFIFVNCCCCCRCRYCVYICIYAAVAAVAAAAYNQWICDACDDGLANASNATAVITVSLAYICFAYSMLPLPARVQENEIEQQMYGAHTSYSSYFF